MDDYGPEDDDMESYEINALRREATGDENYSQTAEQFEYEKYLIACEHNDRQTLSFENWRGLPPDEQDFEDMPELDPKDRQIADLKEALEKLAERLIGGGIEADELDHIDDQQSWVFDRSHWQNDIHEARGAMEAAGYSREQVEEFYQDVRKNVLENFADDSPAAAEYVDGIEFTDREMEDDDDLIGDQDAYGDDTPDHDDLNPGGF